MAVLVSRMSMDEFIRRKDWGALAPLAPPDAPTMTPELGRELVQIMVSDIKKRFSTGTAPDGTRWKPLKFARPRGGNRPLLDTGRLRSSIVGRFDMNGVTVGTAHPGAALQNFGGTVRPVKGKFLAIPLTKEAQRNGTPRQMTGTDVMPLFARMIGGRMIGHFMLLKKVTIPARPFIGLSAEGEAALAEAILEAAAEQWEGK